MSQYNIPKDQMALITSLGITQDQIDKFAADPNKYMAMIEGQNSNGNTAPSMPEFKCGTGTNPNVPPSMLKLNLTLGIEQMSYEMVSSLV